MKHPSLHLTLAVASLVGGAKPGCVASRHLLWVGPLATTGNPRPILPRTPNRAGLVRVRLGDRSLMEKPLDIPVPLDIIHELLLRPETAHFSKVLRAWTTGDQPGAQG